MAAIGIDLGTTNSAAAYCRPGTREPKILPTRAGGNLTPSIVSLRRRSRNSNTKPELLVGKAAANNAVAAAEDTVFSIKRLMGRTYDESRIIEVRDRFNYTIAPISHDDPGIRVKVGDEHYTPVEISALILRQIKEDAVQAIGADVTHAVITVPAYFEERQRAATREAGQRAGLIVKKIIDEPTAAAIAFGIQSQQGERHRILVYDLGGGTFDISILQMVKDNEGRDQVQVMQIEGDNWLGGDDFDRKIVEFILRSVRENDNLDLSNDKRFLALAKKHAEEAKWAVGASSETEIVIPGAFRAADGTMVDVDVPLRRSDFEEMIRDDVGRTMVLVRKALQEQNLTPEDISDVLLVGGSTLVPMVYETVESFFGKGKVKRTINPMECVALGAGVLANTLAGVECPNPPCKALNDEANESCEKCGTNLAAARSVGDTGVTEITAMSLGVAVVKDKQADVFVPIIPKGTPYPLREPKKETFLPTSGKKIRVPVYEGDNPIASQNEEQGVVEYELPQEIDVNTPVEVSFNYDRNRALDVTIRVHGTSLIKTERLRRDQQRTPQPTKLPGEDQESWQDELEHMVEFMQGFMEQYGQYMDVNQRRRVENDLKRAQELMFFPDEVEGKRTIQLLQMHVFNSGLASQIYLAERATDGAEPEVAHRIGLALNEIRRAHSVGDSTRVQAVTNVLRPAVAQAMQRRTGIEALETQEDFGGLLRSLER